MTARAVHRADDAAAERVLRLVVRVLVAYFGDDVETLRAGSIAVDSDGRGVANTRDVIDDVFDVARNHVFAADDHDVLQPSGHEDVAAGIHEAEVAGPEPAVVHQHARGRFGVV